MPEIDITCPECGNRRGVPDDLVGKKIKCKKCQSVFTVKAPAAKPAKPAKPAGPNKTAAPPNVTVIPIKKEEEKEDRNPYVMREENLAARCPFCALLLDLIATEALISAQQLRNEIREQAEKEGSLIIREARAEAERLLDEARSEVRRHSSSMMMALTVT